MVLIEYLLINRCEVDKKITLDEYEQEIEDNIGKHATVKNLKAEMANIKEAARNHYKDATSI